MVEVDMFDVKIEDTKVRHLKSKKADSYSLSVYDEKGNRVVLFFDTKDQVSKFAGRIFEQLRKVK